MGAKFLIYSVVCCPRVPKLVPNKCQDTIPVPNYIRYAYYLIILIKHWKGEKLKKNKWG